jgi:2-hydroxychromene-2-carboxylate isomerase
MSGLPRPSRGRRASFIGIGAGVEDDLRMLLYLDLMSPYAYLAAARAEALLGERPDFEPVLVGAIFALRGWGSWGLTDARAEGIAECDCRAARYGLPPIKWPPNWPSNSLHAMRVATVAKRAGVAHDVMQAIFRVGFVDGVDIADPEVPDAIAREHGIDPIISQDVKDELRATTEVAYGRGVVGVPCLESEGRIVYGDDRLEELVAT